MESRWEILERARGSGGEEKRGRGVAGASEQQSPRAGTGAGKLGLGDRDLEREMWGYIGIKSILPRETS